MTSIGAMFAARIITLSNHLSESLLTLSHSYESILRLP